MINSMLFIALICAIVCTITFIVDLILISIFFIYQGRLRVEVKRAHPELYEGFYSWVFPLGGGIDYFRFIWQHECSNTKLSFLKKRVKFLILQMALTTFLFVVLFGIAFMSIYFAKTRGSSKPLRGRLIFNKSPA